MGEILTWVTTMGTSIFAVVNPIWAYCKKESNSPDKVYILYSENNKRILNNLEKTMNFIIKILMSYSNNQFNVKNLKVCPFEREDIDIYEKKLKEIILKEIKLNPEKIILDMTPGRKYMSALMMLYGIKDFKTNIPFEVLYLHLYDDNFFDCAYPLIPTTENRFINIFSYRRKFIQDLEFKINQDKVQAGVNLLKVFEDDFIEHIDIVELLKQFILNPRLLPEGTAFPELIDHYRMNPKLIAEEIKEAGSIEEFLANSGIIAEFTNNPEVLEQLFNMLLNRFLILLAIFLKNKTINQIRNFSTIKGTSLNKKNIRYSINNLTNNKYILSKKKKQNNQEFNIYELTKNGNDELVKLINFFLK